ncbi:MAG TPA: DUF192 domain-containing protein [Chloroflexota bacterium]|nr:DUF192 domain-containing protein [Chloroflexota bacterium]
MIRQAGRRGFLAALGLTVACRGVARSQEEGESLAEGAPPVEEPQTEAPPAESPVPVVPQAVFEDVTVSMEVARTDAERQKGLGGHAPLGETDGMLFVFERPSFHAFWMKGMLFPLDLMWIERGQVVYVERNAPNYPPDTPDRSLPVYAPMEQATYVLEVNAGFADRYGIGVGSAVELRGI